MIGGSRRWSLVGAWVALALLVPALAVTIALGLGDRPLHQTMPTAELTSAEFASLPGWTVDMYHYAADHPGEFASLPCYCGCDRTLGHRHLLDCFVTPTGGWDRHASGCGVCTTEALDAQATFASGADTATVRARLVATYGPPTTGSIT